MQAIEVLQEGAAHSGGARVRGSTTVLTPKLHWAVRWSWCSMALRQLNNGVMPYAFVGSDPTLRHAQRAATTAPSSSF